MLNNPIKSLVSTTGAKHLFINLICLRFERFKKNFLDRHMIPFLFSFIMQYTAKNMSLFSIYTANLLLLEYSNSYRTYRHLFSLPVNGQRTWGGGGSIRITKSHLYFQKVKRLNKKHGISGASNFMAEIVNMLWYFQWYHEWLNSYIFKGTLPWYIVKKKKWISITMMNHRKIESFYDHPFRDKKKKHHKKKRVVDKQTISIGFTFGFTRRYSTNLFK